jgi:membrane fusion protein, multidrug efflux system
VIKRIVLIVAGAIAGAFVTFSLMHKAPEEAPAAEAPQRVSVVDGEPTVTLDDKTQREIGLATGRVEGAVQSEGRELFGTVLDVQDLASLENQAAAARAQAGQAGAKAAFDRAELQRLRLLNADNKNVSDRAVQEAAANVAADEGAATSANAQLRAAQSTIAQRFGPAVVPLIPDLVAMRTVLVQITMPFPPPRSLKVGGVEARFVSAAPRVDARLQGTPYLYVAPAGTLAAGMNVIVNAPVQGGVTGAVFPPGSTVSWNGRTWVYVRRSATQFSRRDAGAVKPGDEVVTSGAQQLLSEEMRAQLHED